MITISRNALRWLDNLWSRQPLSPVLVLVVLGAALFSGKRRLQ